MINTTVKIPKENNFDYDYVSFIFKNKNSYDDYHIYRTSDGQRYNLPLTPELSEKTADTIGRDGQYYFNTFHKKITFSINFAFESVSESDLRNIRKWLDGKEQGALWFPEIPYKVYTAKVTGSPTLQVVPFDEEKDGITQRVYKGTGSVQFVCYWPYAHTPQEVLDKDGNSLGNGKYLNSYSEFNNYTQWAPASGLLAESATACNGENLGDLPAPFMAEKESVTKGEEIQVANNSITVLEACSNFKWDSKTGLITGVVDGKERPINFSGTSVGAIPVGAASAYTEGLSLNYDYWYY